MAYDIQGNYDFGLAPENNRLLSLLEAIMMRFDNERKTQALKLTPKDALEMIEICDEGVQSFEGASKGICPLQRTITGIRYTLNSLKEWKEKGALHGA